MKYPKLSALSPNGEPFDSSAVNEGVWLTQSHLDAVEQALTNSDTLSGAVTELQNRLDTQIALTNDATQKLDSANTALTESNEKVISLTAEVAELKDSAAGEFEETSKGADPVGKNQIPFHLSDADPTNKLADSLFGAPADKA